METIISKRIMELEGKRFKLYVERDGVTSISQYQKITRMIEDIDAQIKNQETILRVFNERERKEA